MRLEGIVPGGITVGVQEVGVTSHCNTSRDWSLGGVTRPRINDLVQHFLDYCVRTKYGFVRTPILYTVYEKVPSA